jgi:outer membrane receptor protein involved in Fe transport
VGRGHRTVKRRERSPLLAAAAAGICAAALASGEVWLSGTVEDASGQPIPGATVTIGALTATTDARGRFELVPPSDGPLVVSVGKAGFRPVDRALSRGELGRAVRIVLEPAPVTEEIVVTARGSPARLGDTAASVVVVSGEELESAAAPTMRCARCRGSRSFAAPAAAPRTRLLRGSRCAAAAPPGPAARSFSPTASL